MCSLIFDIFSALIVQWLGHLVVAEKTWVRFPLGAHNTLNDMTSPRETYFFPPANIFHPPLVAIDYFVGGADDFRPSKNIHELVDLE